MLIFRERAEVGLNVDRNQFPDPNRAGAKLVGENLRLALPVLLGRFRQVLIMPRPLRLF